MLLSLAITQIGFSTETAQKSNMENAIRHYAIIFVNPYIENKKGLRYHMAASPNLRIAIALQMVRNSIGGTRSASDRSDTVICFVPSVKSFAAQ